MCKKPIKTYVDVGNIVISKLVETENNSKYLIEYFNEVMKPLDLILPKMSEYIKTSKEKNNKLKFLHIEDDKLLEK